MLCAVKAANFPNGWTKTNNGIVRESGSCIESVSAITAATESEKMIPKSNLEGNMRDPARIRKFCDELANIWTVYCPDWRFGQFVENTLGQNMFFYEEEEAMKKIQEFFGVTHEMENT